MKPIIPFLLFGFISCQEKPSTFDSINIKLKQTDSRGMDEHSYNKLIDKHNRLLRKAHRYREIASQIMDGKKLPQ